MAAPRADHASARAPREQESLEGRLDAFNRGGATKQCLTGAQAGYAWTREAAFVSDGALSLSITGEPRTLGAMPEEDDGLTAAEVRTPGRAARGRAPGPGSVPSF